MCGIVGVAAKRDCVDILVEGLLRLEYRGYDSAGLAIVNAEHRLITERAVGKVKALQSKLACKPFRGSTGIAHTRWATHGEPSEANAHPHISGTIAVVHNGIIENYEELRKDLKCEGYVFSSQTDSEVVAHLMHQAYGQTGDMLRALQYVLGKLQGAYALCIINSADPSNLYVAREGSPLVLGVGIGENFVASDPLALRPVTDCFVFIDDGDYGIVNAATIRIWDIDNNPVERESTRIQEDALDSSKGDYKHFMLKEIYEQPEALQRTLDGRLLNDGINVRAFGVNAELLLSSVESIQIVACGTSFHAGLVAKYWFEQYLGLPVMVEVASEFRYRNVAVLPNCLFITISQSGETADTLAALKRAKNLGYVTSLSVCNVGSSSLVRESDMAILTNAGPEIGVASTKAFTTQLAAFLLMLGAFASVRGESDLSSDITTALRQLPDAARETLALDSQLKALSMVFSDKHHALFLGRGAQCPVAMEGALKLKEISYIHAEAYAAGELKHGPLALVDSDMPVIAVAPSNAVLDKVKSNLQEVKARGGKLYVFADVAAGFEPDDSTVVVNVPHVHELLMPIIYSIPLQLLSYYVALVKGTDVDQPRNLAKSVTVE